MIHERGYWTIPDKDYRFDKRLMRGLVRFAKKRKVKWVADIGCGDGSYTFGFRENGVFCSGYDGNPHTPQITQHRCSTVDFSRIADIGPYDMVLCLEVAEHIPAKYERTFIDNLTKTAERLIVLSWAVEGQGGIGHVNCRNNDYVIEAMACRGFRYNHKASMRLRRSANISWFKKTIMVYERLDSSDRIV